MLGQLASQVPSTSWSDLWVVENIHGLWPTENRNKKLLGPEIQGASVDIEIVSLLLKMKCFSKIQNEEKNQDHLRS